MIEQNAQPILLGMNKQKLASRNQLAARAGGAIEDSPGQAKHSPGLMNASR
jgi:hypothetical protein